ncbi:MAG: hypothetical protein SOY48_07655 [Eubacterium sp.]|nr:hypothetical protein [Eubacterium sp.]MDD6567613.1 hypothetical protein [Eubacteriales bacterium]MDY4110739.1 hypothetical protein [Eubacterium sp.]
MKKALSILFCLAFILVSFTACSSNAMTEKNVTKTVDTAFTALKEFDTDTLQKYVDSSTLNTIVGFAQKHDQIKQLGQAIFENIDYKIKSIDLDKKTVTITVKNKNLAQGASDFATKLKNEYNTVQLLSKLNDEIFLNARLNELKQKISDAQMESDGIDITLNIEQGSKNLKLSFDEKAEDAVSGGALSSIKAIFGK